ncbi:hypothetical protein [Bifidobacterium aesculapii]|uniref:hypothetical protein n=1 Tax=Bifidobacterium aesculapii TaxID=1329411 RepID=UPI0006E29073|nr:hypothetical protein [Bifidobacterium aesculapii]
MNGSRDEAQVPFDQGGSDGTPWDDASPDTTVTQADGTTAANANDTAATDPEAVSAAGTSATGRHAAPKEPSPFRVAENDPAPIRILKRVGYVVFAIVKGIGIALMAILGYPLALMAVMLPFMLPFMMSDTNGSYDENAMDLRLGVAVLYLAAGLAVIIVMMIRRRRNGGSGKTTLAMILAIVAAGYGAVNTASYATAIIAGPKTMAVDRPTVTRETKSSDDGDYQVCAWKFTQDLSFSAGSCEDDGSVSANNRIAQDLLHTHSDHVVLRYYDTISGPIYVGLEDDPNYS